MSNLFPKVIDFTRVNTYRRQLQVKYECSWSTELDTPFVRALKINVT